MARHVRESIGSDSDSDWEPEEDGEDNLFFL